MVHDSVGSGMPVVGQPFSRTLEIGAFFAIAVGVENLKVLDRCSAAKGHRDDVVVLEINTISTRTGGQHVAANQARCRNKNPRSKRNSALGYCRSWTLVEVAGRRAKGGIAGGLSGSRIHNQVTGCARWRFDELILRLLCTYVPRKLAQPRGQVPGSRASRSWSWSWSRDGPGRLDPVLPTWPGESWPSVPRGLHSEP